MRLRSSLRLSTFLVAGMAPVAAFATTVSVPNAAQPGRVQEQLRIEQPRPDVGGASIVTVPDSNGKSKTLKNAMTFTLKDVQVKNATVFSDMEIKEVYADKLGQKISLTDLSAIAERLTAKYRNAGYILSRAVVPPQRIQNGVAQITIVEGFVNQVVVEGSGADSSLVLAYADKIKNAKPLNTETLERYLLLIQDLPGVTARAVLRPSPTVSGASDVVITMSEKKVDGSVAIDNRGTRYVGPYQGALTTNFNNMFGVYDRTQVRGSLSANPRELQFFQISHDEQIGTEGTKGTLSYAHTRTRPTFRLKSFNVLGTDSVLSAAVQHPFIRSRQTNLFGTAQFDIRNTDSESLGTPLYADRLKVARIGGSYDFVDRFTAVNRFDAQLSKGFGWDDDSGSGLRSRNNGQTSFWKFYAQASRLQPISGPFSLLVSSQGQAASNALLSAEQFGLGGAQMLSAYDPSEVTGDSGIGGRMELQYSQSGQFEYLSAYQLYTFYDVGSVWTRNPGAGVKDRLSLASAGAGVRFNILEPLSGSLEVSTPLTKDVNANRPHNGDDTRVFFTLAYRY